MKPKPFPPNELITSDQKVRKHKYLIIAKKKGNQVKSVKTAIHDYKTLPHILVETAITEMTLDNCGLVMLISKTTHNSQLSAARFITR